MAVRDLSVSLSLSPSLSLSVYPPLSFCLVRRRLHNQMHQGSLTDQKQMVNLGAGVDTRPYRLEAAGLDQAAPNLIY